jgi:hypothetical protein
MLISDSKKFIYSHIPKTAGQCVSGHLKPYVTRRWGKHRPFSKLKNSGVNVDFNKYFKFCFVRNPWARMVSAYSYFSARKYYCDFESFVKNCIEIVEKAMQYHKHVGRWHVDSYWRYLVDEKDNIMPDFIGKFETLHSDIAKINKRIGVKIILPRNEKPESFKPYWEYYNKETEQVVNNIYCKEIDYFKYKFGDISSKFEVI